MFRHTDTNGIPAEIVSAQQQLLKFLWGVGNLEVASVKVFQFGDYKPTAAPGEFQGRKLRFVGKPTHWIVLHAESAKAKPGEESASKTSVKLEFPVFQKGGRWWIAEPPMQTDGTFGDSHQEKSGAPTRQ